MEKELQKMTKPELIARLKKLEDEERFAKPAKDLAAMKRSLVAEGFTEEQAMEILLAAATNAARY